MVKVGQHDKMLTRTSRLFHELTNFKDFAESALVVLME